MRVTLTPRVSEFYGIAIYMYYNDHAPPHFHAEYGEDEGQFTIESLELLVGNLPRRSKSLVLEWASMYRDDLRENWELAREGLPLKWIPPLD